MKKTLGAILIVLAAIIAVGTFGAQYMYDTAEAVTLMATPVTSVRADDPGAGTGTASDVTEDAPLIAYSVRDYEYSSTVAWQLRHAHSEIRLDALFDKTDPTEILRLRSVTVADPSVATFYQNSNSRGANESVNVLAGRKEGSTTVTVAVTGYVCRTAGTPPTYAAPTGAQPGSTAAETFACTSPAVLDITNSEATYNIWVGWGANVGEFEFTATNDDEDGTFTAVSAFATGNDSNVRSFSATVQDNHEGDLPLKARGATNNVLDTGATTGDQIDRPFIKESFQGRSFTYKLLGGVDEDGDRVPRNDAFASTLQVETRHIIESGSIRYPAAYITVREGEMPEPNTYNLQLVGSDDATDGRSVTVPITVTVTQSNRAPKATVDGDAASDDKTTHAISLQERASATDSDDEAVVLVDFSDYFLDEDNQVLAYSAQDMPATVFTLDGSSGELTLAANLPRYADVPFLDEDETDEGDPKGYMFTVSASDGSLSDSIEVTVTVTARDGVDPTQVAEGTNFTIHENGDACSIVGLVEITGTDGPIDDTYVLVNNTDEFNLNVDIAATHACDEDKDGVPEAATNQLRALMAFNHEDEDEYQLTVSSGGAVGAPTGTFATVNVTITDVNEAPMLGVSPTVPNASGTPVAREFLPTVDASDAPNTCDTRTCADDATTANVDESTYTPAHTVIPEPQYAANVSESANMGAPVNVWEPDTRASGAINTEPDGTIEFPDPEDRIGVRAFDEDANDNAGLTYSLMAADSDGDITTAAFSGPFTIHARTGAITVSGALDRETTDGYVLYIVVTDDYVPTGDEDTQTALSDNAKLTINIVDANELPFFVRDDLDGMTDAQVAAYCQRPESEIRLEELPPITIDENPTPGMALADYDACDADGDDLEFVIRSETDSTLFNLDTESGELTVSSVAAEAARFDYELKASYSVEVEVVDGTSGQGQVRQTVNLTNLNDNAPVWQAQPDGDPNSLSVNENTLRGVALATYVATDADGDPITYTLTGGDASQYQIGAASGVLATLASLDADRGNLSDTFTVIADDSGSALRGSSGSASVDVSVSINNVDDSISSIRVHQANPVLGTNGDPLSALADRKTTLRASVPEAPTDLPAARGTAVDKFVSTANTRWGSVLRIAVLSQSPDASCGNGNQCVYIDLEADDSDDTLKLMAFRASGRDNEFIAAVMPVQGSGAATPGEGGVYKHTDGSVARIEVEEEDNLRIKFGNLRDSVLIDNEAPEFTNFLPEHESSLDEDDVEYTFTVTDAISGIPDPEDLPDTDGDDNYMSVVGLVSEGQCSNVPANYSPARGETDLRRGKTMVADTNLYEGETLWCPGLRPDAIRPIQDDKDFDEVDNGFEVETTVPLSENSSSRPSWYVTFIACDAAGNCVAYDPDENDRAEAFAEITVDKTNPTILIARTGVTWDASDNTYDDDRNYIQVIFDDISDLNPDTIEEDDFVVVGHTVARVYWYDDPDDGEAGWDNAAGTDTRFDRGNAAYRAIAKSVFLELEEDLLPDATPDISVVPNGIEDAAGNEQDDDEKEADDWIAPAFTVQSITSPRETTRDNVLVGEDEKVTLTVTADERISTTKPLVDVNYVNAPAGCVDRDGVITRTGRNNTARADCAVSVRGASLNSVITKDGTNEWTIVVDKPSSTGYYNVYIYGDDRSGQNNRGSEGVAPDKIGADFFEKDGDVNADDAVYFEGDVQLPKPRVVVSGVHAGDTEPEVEQKRPLFIEIDFTSTFSADCDPGDNLSDELNCSAETSEYAEDGFDAVTIMKFELDGVDMTDSVKTTDDETFLVALDDVSVGDHEITIQAMDVAGNELKDELDVEFSVDERDPFTRRLNPGWNLVSLPGRPADGDISAIFTADIEVRTVYTYNPTIPGGWQVAVRETLNDAWQGDLTQITATNGYWVLSDAIQDLEVNIPRLAGGAIGASTPIQPPMITMYAGWNLVPVVDVTGDALDTDKSIDARTYLNSLDDGLDLARVLGFNTITNEWFTVLDPDTSSASNSLQIGSGYWVFVRESGTLVPGGTPR